MSQSQIGNRQLAIGNEVMRDIRYSIRVLLKNPAFTVSDRFDCVLHPRAQRGKSRSVSGAAIRVKELPIADCQLALVVS